MNKQTIIEAVIEALTIKQLIIASHRCQAGKSVQIKTISGEFFNINITELIVGQDYISQEIKH